MKRQQASSAVLGEDTANPLGIPANGKPRCLPDVSRQVLAVVLPLQWYIRLSVDLEIRHNHLDSDFTAFVWHTV